jgi:S-adenosylmethionine:tRNA ribosyltransferase-isomerase
MNELEFDLPKTLSAGEPPEARGLRRDQVRLLLYERSTEKITHARFHQLPELLCPGDVLVLNNSRTLPARLLGRYEGQEIEVRLLHARNIFWQCAISPKEAVHPGSEITLSENLRARVLNHCPIKRVWTLRLKAEHSRPYEEIYKLGRPIQYEHLKKLWKLEQFQTIYAAHPGSVEMPSAGRPFSWELLFKLQRCGVHIAYITLHCGLSYIEHGSDGPWEEEYIVSAQTAGAIQEAKACGRRVIAVGTTVVRTLETVADEMGRVRAAHGWTKLHITPGYRIKVIDGLLTGFHEPRSSHLDLMAAFAGVEAMRAIYKEALRSQYLWHEFGDANLIL